MATPLIERSDLKDQFDQNGFVVVRRFLSPDEQSSLEQQLDRYIRTVVPSLPGSDAFFVDRDRPETLKQLQHMGQDPFFAEYRSHPRWMQLAAELLGEPCTPQDPEWFNKPPGTEQVTPPHQDNFYFCLTPPSVVTLWLALDAVDSENGCLRYVLGSHRLGIRPHLRTSVLGFSQGIPDYSADDEAQEITMNLAPGDLLAHHGQTIHRADPNKSESRHRRAFAMVFRGNSCKRDEDAFARYEASLNSQHDQLGLNAAGS